MNDFFSKLYIKNMRIKFNCSIHISHWNLIVFWVVPSLLSSAQLFYYGTYLVHRELPLQGQQSTESTQNSPTSDTQASNPEAPSIHSTYRPYFWSLVTCYHFGYHQEHHEFPNVPWWKLPGISKQTQHQQTQIATSQSRTSILLPHFSE